MSYFKYILKGFKNNLSRLLAIIAIITLGIGFLVGLTTSSEDIRASVDTNYHNTNMMDINLKSNVGFSEATIKEIDDRSDMDASGAFLLEARNSYLNDTLKLKTRLISRDLENMRINKLSLIEGRMPENDTECVALADMEVYQRVKLNDKIRVVDSDLEIDRAYTVVGIVESPEYFARDKEYNLTGSNRLDLIFFVDSNYYDFGLITDIYIKTNDNRNTFSGAYFDSVNKKKDELMDMEGKILAASRNKIKLELRDEIMADGYTELTKEVDKKIKDEIKDKILAPNEYKKLTDEVDKKAIEIIRAEIDADPEAQATIRNAVKEEIIPELKKQFDTDPAFAGYKPIIQNDADTKLKNKIKADLIAEGIAEPTADQINEGFNNTSAEVKKEYYDASLDFFVRLAYDFNDEQLTNLGLADLVEAKKTGYNEALDTASKEAYADVSLEEKTKAYNKAVDTAVETAFTEMEPSDKEDAYSKALDALIDEIYVDEVLDGKGEKLFALNLKMNQSYVSVRDNANKIDKIAVIFPVFFYFIAALVALTTITRLVNEERSTIGLFKSLGFSKFKILSKYLIFALVCSLVGSLLGNLAGVYLLPYVVYGAYSTILELPPLVYTVEGLVNGISICMMVITVMGVATYVTLKSLKEKPAELLLPKAPKPGQRLLLERWKGLWKRISFKYKNTLRNIFRYKKNLIMMMAGVGGCVALLLTAFGIRDAFDKMASSQYDDIVLYDLRVSVDKGTTLPANILDDMEASIYLDFNSDYLKSDNDEEYPINVVRANSSLASYYSFMDGKKKIEFKPGSVIIDAQLAKVFSLKKGSELAIKDSNNKYIVSDIFENHLDNYIFIYDDDIKSSDCNTYLLNMKDGIDESKILDALVLSNVTGVESISQVQGSFDTMLSSVVLILIVVIICSGALAIIVIYNLTNININERFKEIATLKVLGYQNKEVYGYIYREIFILTLFGILLGFVIGPFLYRFVMLNLNEPGLFLPLTVHPLNYLYSFLFTILFAFIVDLILVRKIKKIQMVESLKCVD